MIEVEAKVKVENISETRKKISEIAKLVGKQNKIDDYYTIEPMNTYPKKSLRIRRKGNEYEINFKQKLSYVRGVHAKKESEFNVSDIKNFVALIKDFGFKKWLTKIKTSEVYEIKNNFHIELNNVKNLGWFLEVEYLVKTEKEISSARKQIIEIIKKLEIPKSEIKESGYTKMLWEKRFK